MKIGGLGLLTGWGEGARALPADARIAAAGRALVPLPTPPRADERRRRATRECLLGIEAVEALRRDTGIERSELAGTGTALLYVTAAAYGPSNRLFVDADGAGGALHFPYTAPSAVPAEVSIDFGLRGPYVTLVGGATATLDALWYAARLLEQHACERALVLAVEVFAECADLWARARWLEYGPLVEAAACALLLSGGHTTEVVTAAAASPWEHAARRRGGATLACGPLIALALARAAGDDAQAVTAHWRGTRTRLVFRDGARNDRAVT